MSRIVIKHQTLDEYLSARRPSESRMDVAFPELAQARAVPAPAERVLILEQGTLAGRPSVIASGYNRADAVHVLLEFTAREFLFLSDVLKAATKLASPDDPAVPDAALGKEAAFAVLDLLDRQHVLEWLKRA